MDASRIALLVLLPVPAIVGVIVAAAVTDPVVAWAFLLVCLLATLVFLGWAVAGVPHGIFLGKGRTWSLSITQAVLWTVIVLASLLVLWLARLRGGHPDPLGIAFDQNLLIVMGIPVAAVTGAAALTAGKLRRPVHDVSRLATHETAFVKRYTGPLWESYQKQNPKADPSELHAVQSMLAKPVHAAVLVAKRPATGAVATPSFQGYLRSYLDQARQGAVMCNLEAREARPSDMLTGDELGDSYSLDFGKVQFFVVSLVAMVAYCVTVAAVFANMGPSCGAGCSTELPPLAGAFASLLLTSTVAYLGLKSIPST